MQSIEFNIFSIQAIETHVIELIRLMDIMGQIPYMDNPYNQVSKESICSIPEQTRSGFVKVAVLGMLKSGKSTLVNSLAGKELVKRGAGGVTSITTRIRKGKKNRVIMTFKSWDEINHTLQKALEYFSFNNHQDGNRVLAVNRSLLDIRLENDRKYLAEVYEKLSEELSVTDQGIRPEIMFIRYVLEAYDKCKDLIRMEPSEKVFDSRLFDKHKIYTADPAMAFFLKDVCLEVFGRAFAPNVEIADCQGADSSGPGQLARIIQYIDSTNLIIYCISSRSGLRRSDIGFLKLLRRLDLMENILFVNNCDLSEHENFADLKAVEASIIKELSFFIQKPVIYSFSALYDLFKSLRSKLPDKDKRRFELWNKDKDLISFCSNNSQAFYKYFNEALSRNHFNLLLANPVHRLKMIAVGLEKKAELSLNILVSGNTERAGLESIRESVTRLNSIMEHSMEGAVAGLIKEIEENLESHLIKNKSGVQQKLREFVINTPIKNSAFRSKLKESGFGHILYLMFQDFKRDLDRFFVEEILPDIKTMVAEQEKKIERYFQSLLDSYNMSNSRIESDNDLSEYPDIAEGNTNEPQKQVEFGLINITSIKKILGIALPDLQLSPEYNSRLKASALTHVGLYSAVMLIASFFSKSIRFSLTPGFSRAGARIKAEAIASIEDWTKRYCRELMDSYFIPMIKGVNRDFQDRFSIYLNLNQDMDRLFLLKEEEKCILAEKIGQVKESLQKILKDLNSISVNAHKS